jgi:hypothetical protein
VIFEKATHYSVVNAFSGGTHPHGCSESKAKGRNNINTCVSYTCVHDGRNGEQVGRGGRRRTVLHVREEEFENILHAVGRVVPAADDRLEAAVAGDASARTVCRRVIAGRG